MTGILIATEYPYTPSKPGIEASLLAVLVQDGQGKYRAYIGLARHPDDRLTHDQSLEDAHWVALHGRKMTFEEAVPRYFVGFKAEEYAG